MQYVGEVRTVARFTPLLNNSPRFATLEPDGGIRPRCAHSTANNQTSKTRQCVVEAAPESARHC